MTAIDRSTMVACDDPVFRSAVQATGKNRVAASAPFTQTCLAYTCVELLAGGCQMGFVEDAVGDTSQQEHDIAARRLTQAGAFPYTTRAITNEWWRGDFTSGSAAVALELYGKYFAEIEAVTGRRRCSGGARARQPHSRFADLLGPMSSARPWLSQCFARCPADIVVSSPFRRSWVRRQPQHSGTQAPQRHGELPDLRRGQHRSE